MTAQLLKSCCCWVAALVFASTVWSAPFSTESNQVEVVIASGFDPVPLELEVTASAQGFNFTQLTASSDRTWLQPTIDAATGRLKLGFSGASALISPTTATVTLTHGADVRSVFVHTLLTPLNLVALLDDPRRSRTYGIHRPSGAEPGCVLALDPLTGQSLGSVTVGRRPTDLALSRDGTELFVLNAVDETLSVLDPATLRLKSVVTLPAYENWGTAETLGHVATGPGSVVYYTDG